MGRNLGNRDGGLGEGRLCMRSAGGRLGGVGRNLGDRYGGLGKGRLCMRRGTGGRLGGETVARTGGVGRAFPRGVLVSGDAAAGSFFVAYLIAGLPGA